MRTEKEVVAWRRERDGLLKEMGTLNHLLHGSWLERYSTCARANCACHRGDKHGPRHYVVVVAEGQQHQKYIPQSQRKAAKEGIAQHRRLQEIVGRITEINIALMRKEMLDDNS